MTSSEEVAPSDMGTDHVIAILSECFDGRDLGEWRLVASWVAWLLHYCVLAAQK